MRAVILAVAVTLAAVASPAAGQAAEKQAVAAVKAAGKEQLKAFKQVGAMALSVLDSTLDIVDAELAADSAGGTLGEGMAAAIVDFLVDLDEPYGEAILAVEQAAADALATLADGGDLAGLYPEDLYAGTGGALDDARARLEKEGQKLRKAALKRIAKTSAKADKVANIAVTVKLLFPAYPYTTAVNQGETVVLTQTIRIDFALAASDLDEAADGFLFASGFTVANEDVEFAFFRTGLESGEVVATEASPDRFTGSFQSMVEGGYALFTKQGSAQNADTLAIGLR
jgi:hypothetical protein